MGVLALTSLSFVVLTSGAAGARAGATQTGTSGYQRTSTSLKAREAAGDPPAPRLKAGQHVTVTYCNHQQAKITEPRVLHGPTPAVIYVHGGGWVSGNFDSGGFLIKVLGPQLANEGFVVVSLNYRLGPGYEWPDQIDDVKCAVRYLRANARRLNVYPKEIGAWGESAGGHLVALLGSAGRSAGWDNGPYRHESSAVQAVVDMAGPTDLLTMGNQGDAVLVAEEFLKLLGSVPAHNLGAALKAASPINYIAPGDPPYLIVQADNDTVVYPQQANELAWILAINHVPHTLVDVKGGGHVFDDPGSDPDENQITSLVVQFFVKTLVFQSTSGMGT
jgi:acetyl esterase/lipase